MSTALQELLAKATPGPWRAWANPPMIETGGPDSRYEVGSNEDADLIVAAVNALPALLAENERLRTIVVAILGGVPVSRGLLRDALDIEKSDVIAADEPLRDREPEQ